jgi:membrane-associated phospholipid phosphatase
MKKGLVWLVAVGCLFTGSISAQQVSDLDIYSISATDDTGPGLQKAEKPDPTPTPPAGPIPLPSPTPKPKSLERQFFKNIAHDQLAIWTSPFKIDKDDAKWLVPFGGALGMLIATDRRTSAWVSRRGTLPAFSGGVSRVGSNEIQAAIIGAIYVTGRATGNARARETGVLAAQALVNAKLITYALKTATQRPRPNFDNGRGRFFRGGNSFPSGHAMSSFAIATVVSYEYQHIPLVRYGSLAAAAAVTLSRYSGRNHFFSDLLAGGAIGFLTGRYVYRKHHRPPVIPDAADPIPPDTLSGKVPRVLPMIDGLSGTYGAKLVWEW